MELPKFKTAELAYTIANTPTFLARKIREDEEVQRFAATHSSEDILEVLRVLAGRPPATLRDKYLPLVLIGALAAKGDRRALKLATAFDRGIIRWFHEVLDYLVQITPAHNLSIFEVQPQADVPTTGVSKGSSQTVKIWN